jgi:hypothetical protein
VTGAGRRDVRRRAAEVLRYAAGRLAGEDTGSADGDVPLDRTSTSAMLAWLRANGPLTARPHYVWGCLHAARLARTLGHLSVTVVEMGVAGGNGLLDLERAAGTAADLLDVRVEVVGFDVGTGMPEPQDHRDIPWAIQPGVLPMDEPALRARLRQADLVIGRVEETVPRWLERAPDPVGFVAFDLDLYSATTAAFRLLEAPPARLLPRVCCYFDDVFGYGWTDFTGERAAIADFNAAHDHRKIGQLYGLRYELAAADAALPWPEQIYLAHVLDGPDYARTEWVLPEAWAAAHRLRAD